MFKKLLMVGALLLMLMAGFAMVPAKQAHAASEICTGANGQTISCGADPYNTGCGASQTVVAESDIADNGSQGYGTPGYAVQIKSPTWVLELIMSNVGGACNNMLWAYLRRVSSSGCIYPDAQRLEVVGQSTDSLASTTFCNGAYTNMVAQESAYQGGTFANYYGPIWNHVQITMSAQYDPTSGNPG